MNAIERIWRIGQTGDVNDPQELSPVENIMRNYQLPKASANMAGAAQAQNQPTDNSMWGKFKNFAGSKGGRMVLGGLGTAAAVGLTGGGLGDALGYGVIGAGNTANTIYNKEQDALGWLEKEKERQARLSDAKASRDEAWRRLEATLQAQKDARQAQYDNAVNMLNLNRDFKQRDYERGRQWLLDNPDLDEDTRKKALQSLDTGYYGVTLPNAEKVPFEDFARGMDYMNKAGATPDSRNKYAESQGYGMFKFEDTRKKLSEALNTYLELRARGWSDEDARYGSGLKQLQDDLALYEGKSNIDTNNNIRAHSANAGVDFGYKEQGANNQLDRDMTKSNHDFELKLLNSEYDNELKKDFEQFKANLPVQAVLAAEQKAERLKRDGYNVSAGDIIAEEYLNARLSNENIQSQINSRETTPQIINAEWLQNHPEAQNLPVFKTGTNVTVNNGQSNSEFAKQQGKNMANRYDDYQKAGVAALAQLGIINNMKNAVNSPSVYQGTGGNAVNTLKRAMSSVGFNVNGLSDAAIIESGKSQLMVALRKDLMPGPMSDRDIEFLVNIVPSLGKTPEQNKAILTLFEKLYQRQAQAAEFVNNYTIEHGVFDAQGERELYQFTNRPVFTEEEKAAAAGQATSGNQYGGQNAAAGADTVRMETPDGQIVFVPREEVDEAISHGGRIA